MDGLDACPGLRVGGVQLFAALSPSAEALRSQLLVELRYKSWAAVVVWGELLYGLLQPGQLRRPVRGVLGSAQWNCFLHGYMDNANKDLDFVV